MGRSVEQEIIQQLNNWFQALLTGDPRVVTACYAKDAVLLPTFSRRILHNHSEIRNYFVGFLKNRPHGRIDEHNVRVFGDIALNSGVYSFLLQADPDQQQIQARFTFFLPSDDRWMDYYRTSFVSYTRIIILLKYKLYFFLKSLVSHLR